MREGLFETVVTQGMERELALSDLQSEIASVDPADQPHVIGRHLNAALARRLSAEKDPDRRLELVNRVLELVAETDETVLAPTRELHAMRGPSGPGSTGRYDRRPATPLNDVALLTNSHGEPSLASELRAELTSADSVDLLCAFVMWRGVRLLERELTALREASVPVPCRDHDLHRRDRTRGARPTDSRLRRGGQDPVRRRAYPPSRKGLAVPSEYRLRHCVRRIFQPLQQRSARRGRVERPIVEIATTPSLLQKFRGHVRLLLERRRVRDLRPRS